MRILVFGNPLVEKDSLALQIMPALQKRFSGIQFVEFDAVEELEKEGSKPIILDVVEGIEKSELITDLKKLEKGARNLSMHNFDLRENLLLLHNMGLVKTITILGIPAYYNKKKALKEASQLIETLAKKKEHEF